MKFVFRISGGKNFETQLRTPTLAVRVQLPLGWNTYLFFNTDMGTLIGKPMKRRQNVFVLLIFVLWWCLNCWWMRGGAVDEGWSGGAERLV